MSWIADDGELTRLCTHRPRGLARPTAVRAGQGLRGTNNTNSRTDYDRGAVQHYPDEEEPLPPTYTNEEQQWMHHVVEQCLAGEDTNFKRQSRFPHDIQAKHMTPGLGFIRAQLRRTFSYTHQSSSRAIHAAVRLSSILEYIVVRCRFDNVHILYPLHDIRSEQMSDDTQVG